VPVVNVAIGLYASIHGNRHAYIDMHPALIIVPVLGGVFGPRLWARWELRRFDVEDGAFLPADELARRLLDRHGLTLVRVEVTDMGDHYDPRAKAVRLGRGHFHRASLTAATTAAHEVGHALQDASGDWSFRLHHWLARVAQVTTGVGTVLLLAVPAAALAAHTPAPSRVLGLAAAAMLGSGLAAQLAALPSELDASFGRALPLLRDCCLSDAQLGDARRILLACSLTYLASAAVPALALWPFVGPRVARVGLLAPVPRALFGVAARGSHDLRRSMPRAAVPPRAASAAGVSRTFTAEAAAPRHDTVWRAAPRGAARRKGPRLVGGGAALAGDPGRAHRRTLLHRLARPLVRGWLRFTGDY
jgi:Zn-dependent membrane protease YugP